MKSFRCVTFGCRVNQYETQAIREQLLSHGYQEVSKDTVPDFVVINSCTVTEAADKECLQTMRSLYKTDPATKIVVMGCLVQRDAQRLKQIPGVRLLVGNGQKHRLPEFLEKISQWEMEPVVETQINQVYTPLKISSFQARSKAFLKVQDGCDRACAFCKIPLVRGRSRSRPLPDLLLEVERLRDNGFREIVLTGVALGLWGREWDPPQDCAQLIRAVDGIPGRFRIRLSSLDPRDVDDHFMTALAHSTKVCHHLHLSLQSGSDPILRRMNRGYTTQEYRRIIEKVRKFWPDCGLTTDLIVGFPGETEERFLETLEFCRQMQFAKVHLFSYSSRGGTSASFFKDKVNPACIKQRSRRARKAMEESAHEIRKRFLGTTQQVLVEESLSGYTSQFIQVQFPAAPELVGSLVNVSMTAAGPKGLVGQFSSKCS